MKLDKLGKQLAKLVTFVFWSLTAWAIGALDQELHGVLSPSHLAPLCWGLVSATVFFFGWGWLTEEES